MPIEEEPSRAAFRKPAHVMHAGWLHPPSRAIVRLQLRRHSSCSAKSVDVASDPFQQAWGTVVAFDVEFAHFSESGRHAAHKYPAQVCIVDARDNVVYRSFIQPPAHVSARSHTHVGGVPLDAIRHAPGAAVVRAEAGAVLAAADLVVAYGMTSDAKALGIDVPRDKRRCLQCYAKFHTAKGAARKLKDMAEKWLGVEIQSVAGMHDAEEDARATMALFRDHVLGDPTQLTGADLDRHCLCDVLTWMATRRAV